MTIQGDAKDGRKKKVPSRLLFPLRSGFRFSILFYSFNLTICSHPLSSLLYISNFGILTRRVHGTRYPTLAALPMIGSVGFCEIPFHLRQKDKQKGPTDYVVLYDFA